MGADDQFQAAAEKVAETLETTANAQLAYREKRRGELTTNLLLNVQQAAQARANLISASQGGDFRGAANWRQREAEAQMALSALIEFEAGLL